MKIFYPGFLRGSCLAGLLLLVLSFALQAQGPGNESVRISRISDAIEGGTQARFRVSLYYPKAITEDVTVQFTVSGTATVNTDYTIQGASSPNTLVIPAGSIEQYVNIVSSNDGVIEGPESVTIQLNSAQSASRNFPIDQTTATIAIIDANSASSTPLQIIAGTNGSEPALSCMFTVKLAGVATSAWPVTVGYAVSGTARSGDDYRIGTIVIPANMNSVNVVLSVQDDQVIESDEEVVIQLLSGSATDGGGNAFIFPPDPVNENISVTIGDNDAMPANMVLSLQKQSDAAEPSTHGGFSIALPVGYVAERPMLLNYTLQGTATRDVDYTFTKQSIPGYTNSDLLPVTVTDDALVEATETVTLTLTNGTIGNNMTFTPGNNNVSLNIADNDAAPTVTHVAVPIPGYYREGQLLDFRVTFSENVVVTVVGGVPSLSVVIGNSTVKADFISGTSTNVLLFRYIVQSGNIDMDGINLIPTLELNGGTIESAIGANASLALNNIAPLNGVFVNTLSPAVALTGTPSLNSSWTMSITFSEAVTGFSIGDLQVANAVLSNLTTLNNIIYTVLVTPVAEGPVSLHLPAGQAQNIGGNGNTASNTINYNYDPSPPEVTLVGVPANGYYKAGQTLNFTVRFNENLIVNGTTATLPVIIGSTTVQAAYTGGPGSDALQFSYTVQQGDHDMDGISLGGALQLNNSTIRDAAGNDVVLTLNNVGNTNNVFVNTTVPTVTLNGNPPAQGPWTMNITFSEAVTGFTLNDIEATNATVSNLATADNITYTVLVTPGATGSVTLRVPADAAVNIGDNGNAASNTINYTLDAAPPVVSGVLGPQDGYHKAGATLIFPVAFNEKVIVTGNGLYMPLTIGATTVRAAYSGGSGTEILQFRYVVLDGQMDMDGITLGSALVLNGSTLKDEAGNNAILTLNNVADFSGVFVNTAHPTVSISTNASARVNAPFPIQVTFSEAVTGFIATDLQVTNGTASNLQTSNNINFTALITPTASGTVTIQLPADRAVNIGDNGNRLSNTLTVTADLTPPLITAAQQFQILQNSTPGTAIGTIQGSDASGILQNWAITNDPTNGAFALNAATGALTVNNTNLLNQQAGQTVTLQVQVTDGLNTSAVTAVQVKVLPVNAAPTLDPIANMRLCATTTAQTITLTGASAVEPTQTYTLSATANQDYFDALTVTNNGVLQYRLKAGVNSGQATITVTIQDNGGTANGGIDKAQRSFTVTVLPLPELTIQSDKGTTVSKGDVVRLTATGGTSYQWDNAPGIVSGAETATLTIRPQQNAAYRVSVENAAGCSVEGSIAISVVEDFKVDATNILTPNGDGKNDRWVVRNIDSYPNNEVKIFDRAGRLVYQRRNYNNEWDGRLNGQPLAEGAYYYILTINNGARTAKGAITIIRDRY
jgi:gliding motility-associated-like protein